MLLCASIYEVQKAREISRLTGADDALHYLECAVLPLVVVLLLAVLLRRSF